jgi:hypothetical protein
VFVPDPDNLTHDAALLNRTAMANGLIAGLVGHINNADEFGCASAAIVDVCDRI